MLPYIHNNNKYLEKKDFKGNYQLDYFCIALFIYSVGCNTILLFIVVVRYNSSQCNC